MEPLVTVLMCTRDRRPRVIEALACYKAQDYANLELVVVDDGADRVDDLLENIPNATYLYYPAPNLSAKRNAGITLAAHGAFVCHFDDDDWSAPDRISHQVALLLANPKLQVVGYDTCYWWDEVRNCASQYRGSIWGATLCYRKSYAEANPWDESRALAEDGPFISLARTEGLTLGLDAAHRMVAVMHDGNARRGYDPHFWPIIPTADLPQGFRAGRNL